MTLLDWLWGSYGSVVVHVAYQDGATEWLTWTYSHAIDVFGVETFSR